MSVDYIVSSLPALAFGAPAPMTREAFDALAGNAADGPLEQWRDLETQLRNAVAEARGGARWKRPARGCSIYWKGRIAACFQEKDVAKRDELIDKVWWDAAGELVPPASPLGAGALAAYSVRLAIAEKRSGISKESGVAAFEKSLADANRKDTEK